MLRLIPEPTTVTEREGTCRLTDTLRVFASPGQERATAALCAFLKAELDIDLPDAKICLEGNAITIAPEAPILTLPASPAAPQSYLLDIDDGIAIVGADPAGVFYGVMSLLQLAEDSPDLPRLRIEDQPALGLRAIHWDLKGVMPTFDYLKWNLKQLARYKMNAIVVEYEDKFVFEKHPAIVSPCALTSDQVTELVRLAHDNFIELIPLVQSLGHAEYVLRHEEYAYVAETEDRCQQFCATNPKTVELVQDFLAELVPLHPSEYVHIGGDETRQLGECPRCAAVVEKDGEMGLYFQHLTKICQHVVSLGKRPIIWDDMLCRNYRLDLLRQLPPETIIMPWIYGITSDKEFNFQGPNHTAPYSRQWMQKPYADQWEAHRVGTHLHYWAIGRGEKAHYENYPEELKETVRPYVEIPESPRYFNATPSIPLIQEAGLEFFAAGAAHTSADGRFAPNVRNKIANLKAWSGIVSKYNGLGLLGTAWARSGSLTAPGAPFEARWHPTIALAEHAWSGGHVDDKWFDQKCNWRLFGVDGLGITDALYFLRNPDGRFSGLALRMLQEIQPRVQRNADTFKSLIVAASLLSMDYRVGNLWEGRGQLKQLYYKAVRGALHPSQHKQFSEQVDAMSRWVDGASADTRPVLEAYMPAIEVDEYLDSVVTPLRDILGFMRKALEC